jgi:hypothetical protein
VIERESERERERERVYYIQGNAKVSDNFSEIHSIAEKII